MITTMADERSSELDDAQRELDRFKGGCAELGNLTVSMRTLYVDVWREGLPRRLLVCCGNPSFICAPTRWNSIDLRVAGTEGGKILFEDEAAGVMIWCETFAVVDKPERTWRLRGNPDAEGGPT